MEFLLKVSSQVAARYGWWKLLGLVVEILAHAFTGVVFWFVVSRDLLEAKPLLFVLQSALLAAVVAIAVDIDHFIAAGSLSLDAALSLPGRPFLHWAGGLPLLAVALIAAHFSVPHSRSPWLSTALTAGWVVLVSWTSHQLRDALRRGFWLWPPPRHFLSPSDGYTSIPPLPLLLSYPLTLACLIALLTLAPKSTLQGSHSPDAEKALRV